MRQVHFNVTVLAVVLAACALGFRVPASQQDPLPQKPGAPAPEKLSDRVAPPCASLD